MPIDVRQIGGVKANDSTDSQLIAALDLRYGTTTGSTGGGSGATVLPTFNPTSTVIFGSPGVSITPVSTGSSTYNVQLGLPASLEAVTSGGGSGSVTVATTLEHGSVGGSDVSTLWGVYPRPDSSSSNKYLLDLTLPTNASLAGGGSSPVTVGVSLSNGSVGATASDWGVKVRQGTTANSYYLDLHLPSNASVAGTGSGGNLTFSTVTPDYTAAPGSANVNISGSGSSYNVKLNLPAAASQSGGSLPSAYVSSVVRKSFEPYSTVNDLEILNKTDHTCEIGLSLTGGAGSVAGGTTPTDPAYIGTGLDWVILDDVILNDTAGSTVKTKIPYGFSAVKMTAKTDSSSTSIPCYGMCLKVKGTPTGTYTQEYYDAMVGFFLVDATAATPPICEFRFVYSFSNDNNLHGFQLFDLSKRDFMGGTGNNAPMFTPWVDLGTMSVQQFADGLSNYDAAQEGFLPLVVKINDAKNPGHASESNSLYYYLLMMKRTDRNSQRAGLNAYGGFGINSAGDPIYLTYAKTDRASVGQLSVGKLAVEYSTNIATFA